jgi:cbb3-type cytochrome oxidase subunit 3
MYRPSPWFEAFMMGVVSFITSFIVWAMILYFLSPWFWPNVRETAAAAPMLIAAPPLIVAIACTLHTYRDQSRRSA